jgi:NTP pyrophosphatase (non-canonical NTP hydrolase)
MHHLSAELADVLFVLVCLANQSGTDLSKAFQESLEKKTIRDKDRHRNNKKLDNKSNP